MIPTAEEFFNVENVKKERIDGESLAITTSRLGIKFAKLHVREALKAALINVDIDMNGTSKNQLPNPHFKIIVDSILNAYPLNIIK